jgi:putative Holliday junction resolvase
LRYLAVDYGRKRTGLALCDEGETMASPLVVVEGTTGLIERIKQTIAREKIGAIVLGLPLNMDGTEGPMAAEVRTFGGLLQKRLGVAVEFFDERLSSFDAEDKLGAMDLTRGKKKKRLDAIAAAAFLQAFLDSRRKADSGG